MQTYYEILGIGRDASQDEMKKAFRQLARQYHPDVNPGNPAAEAKFKIINEAYNTLSDPSLKAIYDAKLESGQIDQASRDIKIVKSQAGYQPFNFANSDRSFENFFGFNPKTNEPSSLKKEQRKNPIEATDFLAKYFQAKKK
jgi:curved DNA-binding protein